MRNCISPSCIPGTSQNKFRTHRMACPPSSSLQTTHEVPIPPIQSFRGNHASYGKISCIDQNVFLKPFVVVNELGFYCPRPYALIYLLPKHILSTCPRFLNVTPSSKSGTRLGSVGKIITEPGIWEISFNLFTAGTQL